MSNQDHLAERLGEELRARADHMYGAPLSFDDVRGQAHRIRRRRRASAAAAIVAAVAVVAVVPAVLSGRLDRADGPQPAPAPTHSAHTAVLHDGEVTLTDGGTVHIDAPSKDVTQFGMLTDGRMVVANQAKQAIQVFAPDGSLTATYPVDLLLLTMSSTDELAAWLDGPRVRVLESGVAEPVALAQMSKSAGTIPMVDAVTGDHCAEGGCRAILSDGTQTTGEVSTDGVSEVATSEPLRVTDVSPDGKTWAVAFLPGENQQYGCGGLYDPEAQRVLARSCSTNGLQFAPDGQHLTSAFFENGMFSHVTVVDRGLQVVRELDPGKQVVSRFAWADDSHVSTVLADLSGRRWTVERVDIGGGDPETLAGPIPGGNPEMMSEYLPSE